MWDEMNAGLDAPVKATMDMVQGRGFDMGRAYNEALTRRREPQKQFREQNPVTSTIANLTGAVRSEEHTSELQSLMRISYAVFCLKKKKNKKINKLRTET